MRRFAYLFIIFFFIGKAAGAQTPAAFSTSKPWAYWWWPGSAVTEKGITHNLEAFAKAGFGGLHIIPIYGAKGYESSFLTYLGPAWKQKFSFVLKEAHRLHLGIDMTLGTGWPLGGAHVSASDAAKRYQLETLTLSPNQSFQMPIGDVQAVSVFVEGNFEQELIQAHVSHYTAGPKGATIYVLVEQGTGQQVKRAAPGGEGLVIDHFSKTAFEHYRTEFVPLLKQAQTPLRALYNDSYEVYGANYTPKLFETFEQLNHYDLRKHLDVLAKPKAETEDENAIWADYHRTLSSLLMTEFTQPFAAWIKQMGFVSRNQAHGSPGNLLDLYAAVDIPETEFFGSKPFDIPGYPMDPDYDSVRFGIPDVRNLKLASSAANLTGKKLVSSETTTWLGDHFKVSLAQVKPVVDQVFIGGVNHLFFHGATYSPPEVAWPGWLFYASTNFNPQSHFWEALPSLNQYIDVCQKMLQANRTDSDVLMYFPMEDIWHDRNGLGKTHPLDLHANSRDWMKNTSFGHWSEHMQNKGYQVDYISDQLMAELQPTSNRTWKTKSGAEYKVLLIPAAHYVSLATMELWAKWVKQGMPVYFLEHLPLQVNSFGLTSDEKNRWAVAKETLLMHWVSDPINVLERYRVTREPIADQRISFIRKKSAAGAQYFIANLSNKFSDGLVRLAKINAGVELEDPLTGEIRKPILRKDKQFYLQLAPGQSLLVRSIPVLKKAIPAEIPSKVFTPLVPSTQIQLTFPQRILPAQTMESMQFWTEDSTTQDYWGKGTYAFDFDLLSEQIPQAKVLHVDQIRDWVRVKMNGKDLGLIWSLPYQLTIPSGVLQEKNHIELEVMNVSANRIRQLDRAKFNWKNFYEINFVNIQYKPFDASTWAVTPSGISGELYFSNR
ncbi:glycosyl hydrolase [Aquirufa regiilacus]|uniref:Glycosyl hydrolase n=1 Tax=Aquirufa regiilacus TaxID=3024868 RepID=A0ABU3TNR5_9BACT|nr:glycosyl hydrolase [Aquirufa sp. LEOWEIH-7C]MDU0807511.1 glycosyl hydrolase [Aquirufa sp. LEOWEIH-7C]